LRHFWRRRRPLWRRRRLGGRSGGGGRKSAAGGGHAKEPVKKREREKEGEACFGGHKNWPELSATIEERLNEQAEGVSDHFL
jgi:hypothetical protein